MKLSNLSKHRPLLACIFVLLLVSFIILIILKVNKCHKLKCLEINNLREFHVKEVYEDNSHTYRALLSQANNLLRVEVRYNIPPDIANQSLQAEITKMKALFENAPAPYPGMISDEIQCDKKFKPAYRTSSINGITIHSFKGFLNDRLVFGSCTEDQAFYRGSMNLFYCPDQKQLYTLEFIKPNKDGDNENNFTDLSPIKCNP